MDLAVFPGAEGFGTGTLAGQGGQIVRVTTLADSGAGSLREAISVAGPKVIVFEVGGTIWSTKGWKIKEPFVTIAGQTAPSPGITLAGAGLAITTHDVLVQHLRIRVGDRAEGPWPGDRDGIYILGYPDSPETYNVVIDHCSISWAIDEGLSIWYPQIHDITVRHCIISEGLQNSTHPKGPHSMGLLIGGGPERDRVAVIGNLFAHNAARNPRTSGGSSVAIVNNVAYNAMWQNIEFGSPDYGPVKASVVGNVVLPGLDTKPGVQGIQISCAEGSRFFLSDNEAPGRTDDPWSVAQVFVDFDIKAETPPLWPENLVAKPSGEVLEWVLANAGARPWDRDAVDKRIVADVLSGTGRIIDSQKDVGGWPELGETHRVLDVPGDPWGDDDGDGYTNLEEWLFEFEQMPLPTNTPNPTATSTPPLTSTPTFAPTNTPTPTNTPLPANTPTLFPASTPTPTATNTPTPTNTPLPTNTSTLPPTSTPTPKATNTPTPTNTPLPTNTPTLFPASTPTPKATNTPTPTNTPLPTNTPTLTPTSTPTPTATNTPTPTNTPLPTNTSTLPPTSTPTPTATNTPTPTNTPLPTNTPTLPPTSTPTATYAPTPTVARTSSPTNTPTLLPTNTPALTSTPTPPPMTPTATSTPSSLSTPTNTPTPDATATLTFSELSIDEPLFAGATVVKGNGIPGALVVVRDLDDLRIVAEGSVNSEGRYGMDLTSVWGTYQLSGLETGHRIQAESEGHIYQAIVQPPITVRVQVFLPFVSKSNLSNPGNGDHPHVPPRCP